VWVDGLRYLGTAACVAAMWGGGLTLPKVFFVIGVFSSAAVVIQAIQIRPRPVGRHDLAELVREFWAFGRWLLWGSLVSVLVSVCGVWTIKFFHGTDSVGEFYAIANSTRLINPLMATLCGLVVQHSAKAFADGGLAPARREAFKLGAITLALTFPYLLGLILMPDLAIRLLYGADSHFRNPEGILAMRVFAVGFVIAVFLGVAGSFLNGIGRTRDSFYAGVVSTVATVTVAFPLTIYYGMLGHVFGGVVTAALQAVALIYFIRASDRPKV
jgi:O-antigen/teichoic acid export membrane protein